MRAPAFRLRYNRRPMNNQRLLIIIAILIGLAALGAGVGSYMAQQNDRTAQTPKGLLWPNPKTFPEVELYDQTGGDFSGADLKGQWTMMFFGFTHCPDICPMTLSVLNRVEQQLADQDIAEQDLRTVFVSVDPKRDTPERLAEYVSYFNEDFIGVSGNPEAIDKLTRSLGAVHHVGEPDDNGDYTVDHSASVFLFDPQGRLVSIFTTPHEADAMAGRFLAIRNFIRQQESS